MLFIFSFLPQFLGTLDLWLVVLGGALALMKYIEFFPCPGSYIELGSHILVAVPLARKPNLVLEFLWSYPKCLNGAGYELGILPLVFKSGLSHRFLPSAFST